MELVYEKFERHGVFRLNRPDRLNALGDQLWLELGKALSDFNADPAMRVGVLTGTGRAFSAGRDLKELAEATRDGRPVRPVPTELREGFSRSPKPFVAAVNGVAAGGGFERALDCDIRIAAHCATFSLPEVRRGLVAAYAIHHLVRVIPFGEAMYLLMAGLSIDAVDAHRIGLVHEVVEADALMARATEVALAIAEAAPAALALTKRVAQDWRRKHLESSYELAASLQATLDRDILAEGLSAFADRRSPQWAPPGSKIVGQ